MNKEQQDKLWSELSEESKKFVKSLYYSVKDPNRELYDYEDRVQKELLESIFGEHNLNPKPQIKTWEDVEKEYPDLAENLYKGIQRLAGVYENCEISLLVKCQATLKIAKLIDLGYGGMVSEEEWENEYVPKYGIFCKPNRTLYISSITHITKLDKTFIAFHHRDEAEEFMSYKSNRKLVREYNML